MLMMMMMLLPLRWKILTRQFDPFAGRRRRRLCDNGASYAEIANPSNGTIEPPHSLENLSYNRSSPVQLVTVVTGDRRRDQPETTQRVSNFSGCNTEKQIIASTHRQPKERFPTGCNERNVGTGRLPIGGGRGEEGSESIAQGLHIRRSKQGIKVSLNFSASRRWVRAPIPKLN
ncbi:Peptidase A2A [Anopheles sinensis]|uniref:Peptidase A2A n=1 Tax=Anopheles sinensis TaxID=74873 RepID=A0A084VX18_ANOSI|nr:Peptidase A2A [Anopheles sinensis]